MAKTKESCGQIAMAMAKSMAMIVTIDCIIQKIDCLMMGAPVVPRKRKPVLQMGCSAYSGWKSLKAPDAGDWNELRRFTGESRYRCHCMCSQEKKTGAGPAGSGFLLPPGA